MQRVAEELGVDITTFSRQIKALSEKGLILRRVSPGDRRVNLLDLTEEGLVMLERIDIYLDEKLEQVFSPLTKFERDCVSRSINLVADVIDTLVEGKS
jgi:DNA-binding MarR family transcriptional regulator